MPFEWFVALRYLKEGRAQTALILSAVSVGVSVVVFLSALINGLQTSLVRQTLGSQPHVTLRAPDLVARPLIPEGTAAAVTIERSPQRIRSIEQWASVLEQVARIPGVTAASPTVTGAAFATRGTGEQPVLVRGVDAERFLAVIDVRSKLTAGRFSVAGSEVVVGLGLSRLLNVGVGDKLRLSTVEWPGDRVDHRRLRPAGNKDVNQRWVLTSLRQAQTLFDLPGGASTIELRVAEVFDADRVALDAADRTGLEANSWMKLNAQLLVGLKSQDSSKFMIQFFVVLAVALGIASVLIVSVVQKSKEIGILRAWSATPRGHRPARLPDPGRGRRPLRLVRGLGARDRVLAVLRAARGEPGRLAHVPRAARPRALRGRLAARDGRRACSRPRARLDARLRASTRRRRSAMAESKDAPAGRRRGEGVRRAGDHRGPARRRPGPCTGASSWRSSGPRARARARCST